jgi:hypothetical protein
MTLRSLAIVAIRLIGIWAYLNTGVQILNFFASILHHSTDRGQFLIHYFHPLANIFLWGVAGVILWFLAPLFASLATRNLDEKVTIPGVSLIQIYMGAFIAVAVYHFINSFGGTVSWIIYLLRHSAERSEDIINYYEVFSAFAPFMLSIFLFIYAGPWAQKLAKWNQNKIVDSTPGS